MKIAMTASEAAPYVKSGGLGDVMLGLPNELARIPDNEVCLVSPVLQAGERKPRLRDGSFAQSSGWVCPGGSSMPACTS